MECIKTEDIINKLDEVDSYMIKNERYYITEDVVEHLIEKIKDTMSFDAEPVVRCKDCKHSRERNEYEKGYLFEGVLICTSCDANDECWNPVWEEHFCSYGEKTIR